MPTMKWYGRIWILISIGIFVSCKDNSRTIIPEGPVKTTIKTIPFGKFKTVFNDMNDLHLEAARKNGISPLASLETAQNKGFWTLARVDSCQYFTIDPLKFSVPYLVPKAKWLLMTIGKNFTDSLQSRGASGYQIVVTSILRTDNTVKKLRKRNVNASENSAHRFGTTFDIAYNRYNKTDSLYEIKTEELRHLLGEVLLDLRNTGQCYVKYEIKQGCFHITVH